jgi:hypothetical protein
MARRVLAIAVVVMAMCLATGCGSSSTTTTSSGTGTLYTFISDTPFCDILSLSLDMTGATLGVSGSTQTVTLLSSLSTVLSLNLAALEDFGTILADTSTTARAYDRISVVLSAPTIVVYDATQNPPIRTISATLTTGSTPQLFNINPPLIVNANQVSAVAMDFDMARSVELDSQGQITGNITPVVTLTTLTASPNNGFGELDGLEGFIRTVQTTSFSAGGVTFIGGFTLQLLPSSVGTGGADVTVDLTNSTQLCGPATVSNQPCTPLPLNQILTDSYAWVDGFLDSGGNFEATTADIEAQEIPADNQIAFIGTVLTVTQNTSGQVTAFSMFQRDQEPPAGFQISTNSAVNVTLSPSTIYQSSAPATNFAGLPFGPSAIAVGQEVVVHGTFSVPAGSLPTVAADAVYLKLQTHQGNLLSLLAVQADGLTGAFTFFPCATMFQQAEAPALPIYVFTNSSTSFVNTTGLSSLTPQPGILVKGLLYLEPQSVTINGVTVPAGKLVLLAKQVVQLS